MRSKELEERGFVKVGDLIWSEDYSWGAFGVWVKGHQLFYDTDAGCSCNWAWDDGVDPKPATLSEIRKEIRGRRDWEGRDASEKFIRKVERAVRK